MCSDRVSPLSPERIGCPSCDGFARRCKKLGELVMTPQVLKVASAACVSVRAGRWCPAAESFLRRAGDAGNADANFLLGMVRF